MRCGGVVDRTMVKNVRCDGCDGCDGCLFYLRFRLRHLRHLRRLRRLRHSLFPRYPRVPLLPQIAIACRDRLRRGALTTPLGGVRSAGRNEDPIGECGSTGGSLPNANNLPPLAVLGNIAQRGRGQGGAVNGNCPIIIPAVVKGLSKTPADSNVGARTPGGHRSAVRCYRVRGCQLD